MKTTAELKRILASIGSKRYDKAFQKYENIVIHAEDIVAATFVLKKEEIAKLLKINRSLLSIILNILKAILLHYKRKGV